MIKIIKNVFLVIFTMFYSFGVYAEELVLGHGAASSEQLLAKSAEVGEKTLGGSGIGIGMVQSIFNFVQNMPQSLVIVMIVIGVAVFFSGVVQYSRYHKNKAKTSFGKIVMTFVVGVGLIILSLIPIIIKNHDIRRQEVRIVLLGAPGAGKGTQAQYLSKKYNIPLISTGDMLRAAANSGTPLGLKVKQIMKSGGLVSDDVIISLVQDRISQGDCKAGYLLDGFPRTIAQAEALGKANIYIDYVVEIFVPDDDIVARLGGRRIHPGSGRVYHLQYNPPKKFGVDDATGEPLVQRDDDKEETIRQRLKVYHEKTEPLVKHYQALAAEKTDVGHAVLRYVRVDGTQSIEKIRDQIFSIIKPIVK